MSDELGFLVDVLGLHTDSVTALYVQDSVPVSGTNRVLLGINSALRQTSWLHAS